MTFRTLRVDKIEIEAYKVGSDPTIRVRIQEVIEDDAGTVIQVIPATHEIHKKCESVHEENVTFTDPETGLEHTLTIAGIRMAIATGIYAWFPDYFDGELVSSTRFVLR